MNIKNKLFNLKTLIGALVVVNAVLLFLFLSPHVVSQTHDFSEIEAIKDQDMDFKELSIFFKDLAESEGGDYAYQSLAKAANNGYLPPVDTHLLGHVVGDVLYVQKKAEGIKYCTDDLRNACSHSIVVGVLLEYGEEGLTQVAGLCEQAPGGKGAYTMCVHGLGHGVLAYLDYDMEKAVKLCERTNTQKHSNVEAMHCVGGVTMEMMSGINDIQMWQKQKPRFFNDQDPLAPCNLPFLNDAVRPHCYVYLTPHLFEAAGSKASRPDPDFYGKAMGFCENIKSTEQDKASCFTGFGKEFIVLANNRNVQSVENMPDESLNTVHDWCAKAPSKESQIKCTTASTSSLYWGGENLPSAATRFCRLAPTSDIKTACFNDLIGAVNYYAPTIQSKIDFCDAVPADLQETCRKRNKLD